MSRRGAAALLAVGLATLGTVATRSFAAASVVTFSTDWSAACTQCQAPRVSGGVAFTVDRVGDSVPYSSTVRTFAVASGAAGWTYRLGKVDSSEVAAVGGGIVYVVANRHDGPGKVLALDAANGGVRWTAVPLHSASRITGVALDGTGVFVVSGDEGSQTMTVQRYDTTGARVWTRRQARGAGDFTASGGNLYVFSTTFTPPDTQRDFLSLYREDSGAGSVVWHDVGLSAGSPHDVAFQAAVVYAVQYVPGEGSGFGTIAIYPGSGDTLWNVPNGATALAVGTHVVISGLVHDGSEVTGLDPLTGAVQWGPVDATGGNPVIVGGVFYTSVGATVYAHSTATGRVRGAFTSADQTFLDLGAAGGHVYAAGATQLVSLTPSS